MADAAERAERIQQEGMVSDGKWNRRVIRHPCGSLCVHEVFYRRDGTVSGWSESFTEAVDGEDGIAGLRQSIEATYEQSLKAAEKPVLEWHEIPHGAN